MRRETGLGGVTRRGFLLGAGAGLAVGGPLGWLGLRGWQALGPFTGRTSEQPQAPLGMPGPFPGRVVETRHPAVIDPADRIDPAIVRRMMDRGMCALTGSDDVRMAWRRFFEPGDVVGIKVNPVGRAPLPGEGGRLAGARGVISSPAVIVEIVRALLDHCGLRRRDIIVFERYANEFRDAGYARLMTCRDLDGCRWYASAWGYDDAQLAIDGQHSRYGRDPHVVGYDPDQFVTMGFAAPEHTPRDADGRRRFHPRDDRIQRSHLSIIVSRLCNKIITVPNLKDHKSAGITIALKNMSHGMNNNVARSHIAGLYRLGGSMSGPNQCNTFIPTAVNQTPLRHKAVLHICDGIIGVYEGGPGCWNPTWGTWQRKSLFFATDPVALDHVGWDIIDAKRAELGWAPVGHMGLVQQGPQLRGTPGMAAMTVGCQSSAAAAAVVLDHQGRARWLSEPFDRRQPEHVALAGLVGLGVFDAAQIEHRVIELR
ncbi:MAG: DUF362 domain-containing protein [Gemmataceae bacterium]|nr:DUF362 domain-containing protein [Gemmataceae bacterium]